jgi:hypothetical protein
VFSYRKSKHRKSQGAFIENLEVIAGADSLTPTLSRRARESAVRTHLKLVVRGWQEEERATERLEALLPLKERRA